MSLPILPPFPARAGARRSLVAAPAFIARPIVKLMLACHAETQTKTGLLEHFVKLSNCVICPTQCRELRLALFHASPRQIASYFARAALVLTPSQGVPSFFPNSRNTNNSLQILS